MILPNDIIDIVQTKQAAVVLQAELDDLLAALFTHQQFDEAVNEHLSYEKKIRILSLCKKYTIDTGNISQIQSFLQEIKTVLGQLPIVTLTIAFSPKQQFINELITWFMVHGKRETEDVLPLFDISIDKSLIGGAVISCNGKYADYSLKKVLQDKYAAGELRLLDTYTSLNAGTVL